jgi:hypothetical protein
LEIDECGSKVMSKVLVKTAWVVVVTGDVNTIEMDIY